MFAICDINGNSTHPIMEISFQTIHHELAGFDVLPTAQPTITKCQQFRSTRSHSFSDQKGFDFLN